MKDYAMAFKVHGVVGDINFLDYGGMLVVSNQGQLEGWYFCPDPENESKGWLNHFELERMMVLGDVATKTDVIISAQYTNDWNGTPAERTEWWYDKIDDICSYVGIPDRETFVDTITSTEPMGLAYAYDAIGSYLGFHELSGGYEEAIHIPKWRKRLALPCYRARKNMITVYV